MPYDLKYGRVTLENQRNIKDDEPVFVFRAKDELLPDLLDAYYRMCHESGSPDNHLAGILAARNHILQRQGVNGFQVPTLVGHNPA